MPTLQDLVRSLLPQNVSEDELLRRFASLYDPEYAFQEAELGREVGQRRSRFGEDTAIEAQRRNQGRALALGQGQEALAAGGASGQLADQRLAESLQPFDYATQDEALQTSRFGADLSEEEKQRRRSIQQRKSAARASYLSDPQNRYEFSF